MHENKTLFTKVYCTVILLYGTQFLPFGSATSLLPNFESGSALHLNSNQPLAVFSNVTFLLFAFTMFFSMILGIMNKRKSIGCFRELNNYFYWNISNLFHFYFNFLE